MKKTEIHTFKDNLAALTIDGTLLYAGTLLQRAAHLYANDVALIYKDKSITYKQLYARACAFARILQKNGVKPKDRVLISVANAPEFYVAYFAAWHIGAVVVPVNTFLIERELAHIISDAQPTAIIVDTERAQAVAHHAQSASLYTTDDVASVDASQPPYAREQLLTLAPDDICALLYTSGTTGVPKGVMLTSQNIMTNIAQVLARIDLTHDANDRVFAVLPLFHVFAQNTCVWMSIFLGITVILVPKIDRREILASLHHKPTLFLGVPALYGLLCLMKTAPLDSVRLFVSGGDALPDKIRAGFALLYHRSICNGYGLTETSPVIAAALDEGLMPTNTIGAPLAGIDVEIRDEWGDVVADGVSGQLWVKGDNVMKGYYNAPEATNAVLRDGWFNTGDLAYVDDSGRLVLTGREKDLIIHKGFNVYPQEVENIIMGHANVLNVGVVGQPDPDVGEYVVAFVQLKQEQENVVRELKQLCMQQLAAYKVPRTFICSTEELPTTATRKVDKKVLRKKLVKK